jgi:hypothetical protein
MLIRRPYIPLGCTQQGRLVSTKLTERHLQLRITDKQERRALGDLLLASGAVEGPFRRTRPALSLWQRIQRELRELWDLCTKPCID